MKNLRKFCLEKKGPAKLKNRQHLDVVAETTDSVRSLILKINLKYTLVFFNFLNGVAHKISSSKNDGQTFNKLIGNLVKVNSKV